MADRCLIFRRDDGGPLPNNMEQEIVSAINRVLSPLTAPAHIQMINMNGNMKGTIMVITHQHAMAAMALVYSYVFINAAHRVYNGVINIAENESWDRLKVHVVPFVRYMTKAQRDCKRWGKKSMWRTKEW
jgi:hypothetical protein